MDIKLIEIFYDGDSFFFTQLPGEIARFNQVRCWSEYTFADERETVSGVAAEVICDTLRGLGYTVTCEQYEGTDAIDGGPLEPVRFNAQQDDCATVIQHLLTLKGAHELFPRKEDV